MRVWGYIISYYNVIAISITVCAFLDSGFYYRQSVWCSVQFVQHISISCYSFWVGCNRFSTVVLVDMSGTDCPSIHPWYSTRDADTSLEDR